MKPFQSDAEILEAMRSGQAAARDSALRALFQDEALNSKVRNALRLQGMKPEEQYLDYLKDALLIFDDNVQQGIFDPARASIHSYLVSIAKTRQQTWHRSEKRRRERETLYASGLSGEEPSAQLRGAERQELQALLGSLLEDIGLHCRELLLQDGTLTGAEVAALLGYKSANSVKSARYDCLKKLFRRLEADENLRGQLLDLYAE